LTTFTHATRRTFRSLSNRNYRLFFFSQIVSFTGTWMQTIALMWMVLQLTGSGFAVGLASGLQFLPILLFGAWGGVFADRFDKRKLLIITQSMAAILALALGALAVAGAAELWVVFALTLLLGFVTLVDNPTRQAFVGEMVARAELPNAIGLNSAIVTSARMVGPALAGVVIATAGVAPCFFINAVSFLAVIGALYAMNPRELRRAPIPPREPGRLRAGLRYAWSVPQLRTPLLLMAVAGTLAFNFRALLPIMAETTFGGDAGTFGALSAAMGIGTLAGALTAAGWSRPTKRTLLASALAFGTFVVATAVAPTFWTAVAGLMLTGAASAGFAATTNALLQLNSPPEMRGRVMSLYAVVFLGTTPIGAPLSGFVAEQLGVRFALALGGVATVLAVTALLRNRITDEVRASAGHLQTALLERAAVLLPGDPPMTLTPFERETGAIVVGSRRLRAMTRMPSRRYPRATRPSRGRGVPARARPPAAGGQERGDARH
jgi:MFS family permease